MFLKNIKRFSAVLLVSIIGFVCFSCSKQSNGQVKNEGGKYDRMYYMAAWQLSAEGSMEMMQAFNTAKSRISNIIEMANDESNHEWSYKTIGGKKVLFHNDLRAAIISDIDDTLVNGSNYSAKIIGASGDWNNAAFARFVMSDNCIALPGSVEFVNYCVDNGIDFYYLTNRYDQGYKIGQKDSASSYEQSIEKDGKGNYVRANGEEIGSSIYQVFGKSFYDISYESMQRLGFPVNDQMLLINDSKLNGSSKQKYRDTIVLGCTDYPNGVRENENALGLKSTFSCDKHDIIMLLGDQSTDFTDDLTANGIDAVKRAEKALEYSEKFGREWIILPNGIYGTSQDAANKYGYEKLFTYYSELNM